MQIIIQYIINCITLGAMYALIALGFNLVFGVLKFSNWSHGGTIMISAYAGYFACTILKFPLFSSLLVSILVGGVLAIVIEKIAIRPIRVKNGPLIYFFVTSINMSLLLTGLVQGTIGSMFYTFPTTLIKGAINIGEVKITTLNLFELGTCILAIVVMSYILKRTRIGIAIRAASSDLRAASLMGIEIDYLISIAFLIAGALAGIAGFFAGVSYTVYPQMSDLMVKGFEASVIGGLGNFSGAIYGGLLLSSIEIVVTLLWGSSFAPIVTLVVLFIILIFRPQGIAGSIVPEKV